MIISKKSTMFSNPNKILWKWLPNGGEYFNLFREDSTKNIAFFTNSQFLVSCFYYSDFTFLSPLPVLKNLNSACSKISLQKMKQIITKNTKPRIAEKTMYFSTNIFINRNLSWYVLKKLILKIFHFSKLFQNFDLAFCHCLLAEEPK